MLAGLLARGLPCLGEGFRGLTAMPKNLNSAESTVFEALKLLKGEPIRDPVATEPGGLPISELDRLAR